MAVEKATATEEKHAGRQQSPVEEQRYVFPMTFAQQRLFFLYELDPTSTSYNIPWSIRITGQPDVVVLEGALNEIVRRHEILRTTFDVVEGHPVQVIAPAAKRVALVRVDLSHYTNPEQEAQRAAMEEAQTPLDLRRGPILRTKLLQLRPSDFVLLMTTHHIAFDGWSRRILVSELQALYRAYTSGEASPLPELPLQYADYAVWQRQTIAGEKLGSLLGYWRQQLEGAPTTLDLPTDRPRPAVQRFRGAGLPFTIPKPLSDEVQKASRQFGTTSFMTLLTAFYLLLARYSGQDDIVIGGVIANRNRAEVEGLIGLFANTLPMRTKLGGDPSFRELLERVRDTALGAYAHQDMPFDRLVEEMRPERSPSYNPLFQVLFTLQGAASRTFELSGLKLEPFSGVAGTTSKFDLSFFLLEGADGLGGKIEYNTDLFDAETIDRMLRHYLKLLENGLAEPEKGISKLQLLDAAEREQVVVQWNNTAHAYPRERSLHEFIEGQAERTPDALALVFESQRLTYRELNGRANQLAHRLREMGVGPEKLVAVCAHRSVEMVVALLGTIKAGGAYVPIDPEYPTSRLKVMLADAEPSVLLTQEYLLDLLPPHTLPTICLDRDWHTLVDLPTRNLPVLTTGKDQAYVIYTSGSTGRPKGVPNVHEGIVNRLLWMQSAYGLDGRDRVMQKTPYSFDVSVWEFFWPLMTGACIVMARPDGHKDPSYLIDLIQQEKITTLHFVPSMLRIFLEADDVESCTSLRRVICSGEALPFDLQQRFFKRLNAELHNLYGPTEASIDVSFWQCLPNPASTIVPIGRPVWNTQLYVLDRRLQPVPVGVPGELHIGGVQLARGYLKQPELTAEKFIPDPFSSEVGARLYRTGDLARFLPDGSIDYLGRIDHQVKLRGFRIELGEIEAVLLEHGDVDRTVVVVREDQPGNKVLAAYFVPKTGATVDAATLRAHLDKNLPAYMVPAAFIALDALPITDNGKINRRALPAPDWSKVHSSPRTAPSDDLELMLVRVWEKVLGVSNIGTEDNFFDLGGHSILAVRLLSEVEKIVGRKVPLASLFRAATVASQAQLLREGMESEPEPLVLEYQLGQAGTPTFFAVAAPGVRSLGYALLARQLGEKQPFYKLQAAGPIVQGRPLNMGELRALAQQYIAGMRAVQPEGPYFIAAMCGGCQIAEQMILQLESLGQTVAMIAIFDTWVMEHAHRWWGWVLFGAQQRLRWLRRVSWMERVKWLGRATKNRVAEWTGRVKPNRPWAEAYWPQDFQPPRFKAPVILFKRPKQPYFYVADPLLGWGDRSEGGVTAYEITADHHEVLREPHVQFVSRILQEHIEAFLQSSPEAEAPNTMPAVAT